MKLHRIPLAILPLLLSTAGTAPAQTPAQPAPPKPPAVTGPRELLPLRSAYEAAIQSTREKYAAQLRLLVQSLKTRGDINGAQTVAGELQTLNANPTADTTRAAKILIPKLMFKDATIQEGVQFLQKKSRDLDPNPDHTGVPIVLLNAPDANTARVSLDFVNISIADAAKYIALAGNLKLTRDGEGIILSGR